MATSNSNRPSALVRILKPFLSSAPAGSGSPSDPGPLLDRPSTDALYHNLDQWLEAGKRLTATARQNHLLLNFAIGDWYNSGVAQWGSKAETAARALPQNSYASIRQYAYVAHRFPEELRLPQLSLSTYRHLAPEPEDVRFPFLERILSGTLQEEEWQDQVKEMCRTRRSSRTNSESRVRAGGRSAEGGGMREAQGAGPRAAPDLGPGWPSGAASEQPGNLRQCLTPTAAPESRVGGGRHSAIGHPAEDLGPTAVGPCARSAAPPSRQTPSAVGQPSPAPESEDPNMAPPLTSHLSPPPALSTLDSRLSTPALAAWILSNYSEEERRQLAQAISPEPAAEPEPGNLLQCLTPPSDDCRPTSHDCRPAPEALAEERHELRSLRVQEPQGVPNEIEMEFISTQEKPRILHVSQKSWSDWETLAWKTSQDMGKVLAKLLDGAELVYGPHLKYFPAPPNNPARFPSAVLVLGDGATTQDR